MHDQVSVTRYSSNFGGLQHLLAEPGDFAELLPVAAYACDASGRILWFNQLAAALWGRSPLIGDDAERFCGSYRLYFGGREVGRDETPMAHALRTGEPVKGAGGVVERPDGSRVWMMVHIAPIKDERGRVVGAINCFHDTTELHRANDALREKQDELEDFFENGAIAMHIVSKDGVIMRANKAELEMLGYDADEYIDRNIAEFHVGGDAIADILARLGSGEKLERYPARLKAKDGTIRHVAITSSPRFKDGRFLNTRCFTHDVTAETRAKQRAAEMEDRYRKLLESLPAAVYTTDAEGRITYFNQAAVELSGRTPELGTDTWCVTWRLYATDGKPMPHDQCPMAIALKEQRPVRNVEALAERPDGTLVPFLSFPTPLRDTEGRVIGAVNMLIDISERKQAEDRQIVLLKELNHRVKNNLQMLQSLLSTALRETANPEAQAVLTGALRRVVAIAAAQRVLYGEGRPTTFTAQELLESVCTCVQRTFDKRVTIEIEAALGVFSNDTAVPLALILNELLTNAVKHGTNDGASATVRVGVRDEGEHYRLWIRDEGPGFDPNAVGGRRSSGLGLVSGLVRQLCGTLEVERAEGTRCVVTFAKRAAQ